MCRRVRAIGAIAVLLALASSAPTQERKPEAPAASRQDKTDIPPVLDSWYKMLQGTEHVGHVHERLARQALGGWRYDFHVNVEIDMMVPDPKEPLKKINYVESRQVDARLDDTYAPQSLRQTDFKNGVDVVSAVYTEEAGRRIDISQGGAEPKRHTVTPEEEVHYSRALMFIFLRQNELLSRPGTRRAILFHPMEDGVSPLAEVQLDVQEMSKREYLGKKEVSVTRVVYIKPPPAATRDAELVESYVDKYGRVLEETTRGGLRKLIAADSDEAVGAGKRLLHRGRRDPFTRPRYKAAGTKEDVEGATKELVIDNIDNSIKDMQKQLEELQKAKNEGREADIEKHYEEVLRYYVGLMKVHEAKPMGPNQYGQVQAIRQQAEPLGGGVARIMKRMRGLYVQIGQHFDREECSEMEKGIAEMKKTLQDEKALRDMPEQADLGKLIGELEPLVSKCKTRMELGKKKLVLTGTMLHDKVEMIPVDPTVIAFGHTLGTPLELRFVKPNRMAVINERSYRVGDMVEGEGVRVEKIWAHGVQVSLRDETRDVPIRQK